jgi:hypothetical protein
VQRYVMQMPPLYSFATPRSNPLVKVVDASQPPAATETYLVEPPPHPRSVLIAGS